MPDPSPERHDIDDYLEHSDIIDYDHPLVEEVAKQITYGLKDSLAKAGAIYEYVTDQIFNSFSINATSVTKKASEVLDKGHGTCYSKAHLLAALMRASDIPAGFCYQIHYNRELEQLVVHGFNAIYIKELDRWIRIDSCVHTDERGSRFNPDQEPASLKINKDLGEQDDPTVYSNPSKRVLKALSESETIDELKLRMPARI